MKIIFKLLSMLSWMPIVQRKIFEVCFAREERRLSATLGPKKSRKKQLTPQQIWYREQKANGERLMMERGAKRVSMVNSRGDKVSAVVIESPKPTNRWVVLCHGYRSCCTNEFVPFLPYYLEKPVHVLMMDHQAHGESEGAYITFGAQEHLDVLQWIGWLQEHYGQDLHVLLHGISMGAATVLLCSGSDGLPDCVREVVADCGYTSMHEEVVETLRSFHIPERVYASIADMFREKTGIDPESISPMRAVCRAKVPVHIIHGEADKFVPTWMGKKMHEAAPDTTDLLLVPEARHAASWGRGHEAYVRVLDGVMGRL